MSKAEILAEISRLTKEERYEIRVQLAEMDSDGWIEEDDPLTDAEKALIEARLEAHEKNPDWRASSPSIRLRHPQPGQPATLLPVGEGPGMRVLNTRATQPGN